MSSLLCLLALTFGYQWGDRFGLFLGLVGSLTFLGFFFLQGDEDVLAFYKATRLYGQDPWQLLDVVQSVSQSENVRAPDIYVFDHPHLSMFSYWSLLGDSRICISSGCLKSLSLPEYKLLVTHQILFLKSTNSLRFQFCQRLFRSFVHLGRCLDHLNPFQRIRTQQIFSLERFFGLGADALLKLVYRPHLYEKIDSLTCERIQDKDNFGEILWRARNLNKTLPLQLSPGTRHLFFLDPLITPENIKKRITKLIGYYPI
jgi:hypothetical protein